LAAVGVQARAREQQRGDEVGEGQDALALGQDLVGVEVAEHRRLQRQGGEDSQEHARQVEGQQRDDSSHPARRLHSQQQRQRRGTLAPHIALGGLEPDDHGRHGGRAPRLRLERGGDALCTVFSHERPFGAIHLAAHNGLGSQM
jgi:hypothetical protein